MANQIFERNKFFHRSSCSWSYPRETASVSETKPKYIQEELPAEAAESVHQLLWSFNRESPEIVDLSTFTAGVEPLQIYKC